MPLQGRIGISPPARTRMVLFSGCNSPLPYPFPLPLWTYFTWTSFGSPPRWLDRQIWLMHRSHLVPSPPSSRFAAIDTTVQTTLSLCESCAHINPHPSQRRATSSPSEMDSHNFSYGSIQRPKSSQIPIIGLELPQMSRLLAGRALLV